LFLFVFIVIETMTYYHVFQEPHDKGCNLKMTKFENWRCSAGSYPAAPSGKSWRLAEGIQSQNALLVCSIGFA